MKPEGIKKVYFIGIGGIGMSAIARFFKARGCEVAGYDKSPTALTGQLLSEGIEVSFSDHAAGIPAQFRTPAEDLLVIFTPSVPLSSGVRTYFTEAGFTLYKRAQVLGLLSQNHSVLAVAGTHGKTTTTAMLAHILKYSGIDVSAFLGGIAVNYQTNFIAGNSEWVVVEADEYDRSFLTLFPYAAAITSMDADHLDIYGDLEHMIESYNLFASQVKEAGLLIAHTGLPLTRSFESYAAEGAADIRASRIEVREGAFYFDYVQGDLHIEKIRMQSPGLHNIENALAAIRLALTTGLTGQQIKAGIESFRGVKRRFEYILNTRRHIFIDDYAHHHEELKALIETLKKLYPYKRLTLIFQPHLFSRTRDFYKEMAAVLSGVDELILLDIYPAREQPMAGITSSLISENISGAKVFLLSKEAMLAHMESSAPELLVTAGAGDIDSLLEPLKVILESAERRACEQN